MISESTCRAAIYEAGDILLLNMLKLAHYTMAEPRICPRLPPGWFVAKISFLFWPSSWSQPVRRRNSVRAKLSSSERATMTLEVGAGTVQSASTSSSTDASSVTSDNSARGELGLVMDMSA